MSGNLTEFSDERKAGEFSDLRDFTKRAFHSSIKEKSINLWKQGHLIVSTPTEEQQQKRLHGT